MLWHLIAVADRLLHQPVSYGEQEQQPRGHQSSTPALVFQHKLATAPFQPAQALLMRWQRLQGVP